MEKGTLWCRVLVSKYGEYAGGLGGFKRNGLVWWKDLFPPEGEVADFTSGWLGE